MLSSGLQPVLPIGGSGIKHDTIDAEPVQWGLMKVEGLHKPKLDANILIRFTWWKSQEASMQVWLSSFDLIESGVMLI